MKHLNQEINFLSEAAFHLVLLFFLKQLVVLYFTFEQVGVLYHRISTFLSSQHKLVR